MLQGEHLAVPNLPTTSHASTYGPYRVLAGETLGAGAVGVVHRATRQDSSEVVALKVARSPESAESLRQELALLRRLASPGHPGVVQARESGERDGIPWFAMEDLGPRSLAQELADRRDRLGARDDGSHALFGTLGIVYALAQALEYVHGLGAIHGDLSPKNVFLRGDGEVVLIDFGAAVRESYAYASGPARDLTPATLGYCAPERLLGEAWDSRADLYALGCLWYELASGRPVFASDQASGLYHQHVHVTPPPPSALGVSMAPELELLLMKLLAKDPHRRLARASVLVAALAPYFPERPRQSSGALPILTPRFVGRDSLRASLRDALSEARGAVVQVHGEPGVGKTRLLADVARSVEASGRRVLWATPSELGSKPAPNAEAELHSFRGVLERLARALECEPELARRHGQELCALADFDARIAGALGAREPLPQVADELARQRIFRALGRALAIVAEGHALLLVLDDAQLADGLTLGFVRAVASDAELRGDLSVLVSFALPAGVDPKPAVLDGARAFELAPLSRRETRRLLLDMLAVATIEHAFVEHVYRCTRGNPFGITYYLYAAAAAGRIAVNDARARLVPSEGSDTSLDGLIEQLIRAVGCEVLRVAAVAAIVGRTFTVRELEELLNVREPDARERLRQALESLVSQQLVHRLGDERYGFRHELFRHALEATLASDEASAVHEARARALRGSERALELRAQIGLHWARAKQPALAIPALRGAAKRAAKRFAFERAIELLQQALGQAEAWSDQAGRVVRARTRIARDLIVLHTRAARHEELRVLAQDLVGRSELPALERAFVHRMLALSHRIEGDYAATVQHLDLAGSALSGVRASSLARAREWIEQQVARVMLHYMRRQLPQGLALLWQVLPFAKRHGSKAQRAALNMAAGNAILLRRRFSYSASAVAYHRRALRLFSALGGHETDVVMAMFEVAFSLLLGGADELVEARRLLEDAAVRAESLGDAVLSCRLSLYRAIAARRARDAAACKALAERTLSEATECGLRGYVGAAHGCLAWVALLEDQLELVRRHAAEARAAWWRLERTPENRSAEYPFQWLGHFPLLSAQAAAEDYAGCRETLLDLLDEAQARLAAPVQAVLLAAQRELSDDGKAARAIDACLRAAAMHRYV